MTSKLYWLHTLSPTHVGTGRGMGYIDQPIDRDGVTGWPVVRGSAFKGVWADYHRATKQAREKEDDQGRLLRAAFGMAGDGEHSNAGALISTDAQLVCLPIRSFRGTFAWCTSPLCLQRLHRTLTMAGVEGLPDAPSELKDGQAHHSPDTALAEDSKVYLEDLDFKGNKCKTAGAWAEKIAARVFPGDESWQQQFQRRFVVIPDSAFDFLCETGTEVHTRVRIEDGTKTVAKGALWTEEALPAETILVGVIQCERVFQRNGESNSKIETSELIEKFATNAIPLQIGGKATIGRGQVRCVFSATQGGEV